MFAVVDSVKQRANQLHQGVYGRWTHTIGISLASQSFFNYTMKSAYKRGNVILWSFIMWKFDNIMQFLFSKIKMIICSEFLNCSQFVHPDSHCAFDCLCLLIAIRIIHQRTSSEWFFFLPEQNMRRVVNLLSFIIIQRAFFHRHGLQENIYKSAHVLGSRSSARAWTT